MESYIKRVLKLVECNLDDLNPEIFPFVREKLFALGARDVWAAPIVMKHGRPACCVSVLCDKSLLEEVVSLILLETTTLGVRTRTVVRYELEPSLEHIETKFGVLALKVGRDKTGAVLNVSPEYSSCQAAAKTHDCPLKEVYQEAVFVWKKLHDKV